MNLGRSIFLKAFKFSVVLLISKYSNFQFSSAQSKSIYFTDRGMCMSFLNLGRSSFPKAFKFKFKFSAMLLISKYSNFQFSSAHYILPSMTANFSCKRVRMIHYSTAQIFSGYFDGEVSTSVRFNLCFCSIVFISNIYSSESCRTTVESNVCLNFELYSCLWICKLKIYWPIISKFWQLILVKFNPKFSV